MSEVALPHDAQQVVAEEALRSAAAAGVMLRQAREATGLHVAALAVSLKVPAKKLEALEAGRLDLLPDATFARALAATICRGLKIDPKPVLDLLPQNAGSRLGAEQPAINTPFHASGLAPGRRWNAKPSPAVLAVLALLLGALAIYFFPVTHLDSTTETATGEIGAAPPISTDVSPNMAAELPSGVASSASPSAAPPQAAASAPPGATAAASVAGSGNVAVPSPGSAGPADPARVVVFSAHAESWVEVTDAKGVAALRRTLKAGENAEATGALPLSVVVGRIDAVSVQVRGKPMDLTSIAKNNVARFEVK